MRVNLSVFSPSIRSGYWIAFSGGKDSIAMAHRLRVFGHCKGLLHFNHGLECDDQIEREAVVAAQRIGMPIVVGRGEVNTENQQSLEAACREARYEWIESQSPGNVVVCHHLGDAAEQYFLNLFKGCPEYVPIKEMSQRRGNTVIIRPFIRTPSKDVENYLRSNGLHSLVADDPLNKDLRKLRNRARSVLKDWPQNLEKTVLKKFYQ
jgi:tRNA(Ile)-lysidine synthetase-like protein